MEENPENNDNNTLTKNTEAKPDVSPALLHKSFSSAQPEVPNTDSPVPVSGLNKPLQLRQLSSQQHEQFYW